MAAARGSASCEQGQQHIAPPARCQQTQRATCQTEHQAFRQQLTHEPPAASANRHANGELTVSRCGPGEEQSPPVRAGNHEQQADHCEQRGKRRLHLFPHPRQPTSARHEDDMLHLQSPADVSIDLVVLAVGELSLQQPREHIRDCRAIGLGAYSQEGQPGNLGLRHPRLSEIAVFHVGVVCIPDGTLHHHRQPDVGSLVSHGAKEPGRGHANHRQCRAVHGDGPVHDVRAPPEAPGPERVTDRQAGGNRGCDCLTGRAAAPPARSSRARRSIRRTRVARVQHRQASALPLGHR